MTPAAGMGTLVLWCGAWIVAAVRLRAGRDPACLGAWLAAFVALSCFLLLLFLPWLGVRTEFAARWLHHFGFTALGIFLVAAEYLRMSASAFLRAGDPESAAREFQRLRWVTEIAPAPAAIATIASGLRLVFDGGGGYSLRDSWLFYVVVGVTFFFADGLAYYLPTVRRWAAAGLQPVITARQSAMLRLHALSYPAVLALAMTHPALPHPLQPLCARSDQAFRFLSGGGPQLATALVWMSAVFLLITLTRRFAGDG